MKFVCGVKEVIKPVRWVFKMSGGLMVTRKQVPLKLAWAISIHKSQVCCGNWFDFSVSVYHRLSLFSLFLCLSLSLSVCVSLSVCLSLSLSLSLSKSSPSPILYLCIALHLCLSISSPYPLLSPLSMSVCLPSLLIYFSIPPSLPLTLPSLSLSIPASVSLFLLPISV